MIHYINVILCTIQNNNNLRLCLFSMFVRLWFTELENLPLPSLSWESPQNNGGTSRLHHRLHRTLWIEFRLPSFVKFPYSATDLRNEAAAKSEIRSVIWFWERIQRKLCEINHVRYLCFDETHQIIFTHIIMNICLHLIELHRIFSIIGFRT